MSEQQSALGAEDSVPLAEIAALPDLGLRIIAGDAAARHVRWAHVSELAEPAPYLTGGELLLTAGVTLPEGAARLDAYVSSLAAAGVAALGFGLAPVHSRVPGDLRAACERHGLPLLAVPEETPFLAVGRAVSHALERRRADRRRTRAEAQGRITRAALHGRPRVPAVLDALAGAVDGWALLLDASGRTVRSAGPAPEPGPDLVGLALMLGRGSGPRSATDVSGGAHVDLHPVDSARAATPVLVLGRELPFTADDRAVTAVGVGLLGLLADSERTAGAQDGLTARLLLGEEDPAGPGRTAALLAAFLGVTGPEPVRALHAVPVGPARPAPAEEAAAVSAVLGSPLLDLADGRLRAVVPAACARERADALLAETGWLAAVSRPAAPADLPAASREAGLALERAVAAGSPVVARAAGPGVGALVDGAAAADWAHAALRPLGEDPEADLRGVLRVWLAHHGSWDHTARATGLHRNSVRRRIAQAERLLDADLGDPGVRAQLWLALSWAEA